jgi:hypothetical protein
VRTLGLVYALAFGSLYVQIDGLLGPEGILPVSDLLRAVAHSVGPIRYWLLPTVFWLGAGTGALKGVCALGTLLGLALACGILPLPLTVVLWALYLSIVSVGQVFLGYQWDALLLEAGLLAFFCAPWGLAPRPPRTFGPLPLLALRFLLFRLMFASGLVKLLAGDPTWRSLTALRYHYETQPLPTFVGYYASRLPDAFATLSTALMFGIELLVPFLILFGRRARLLACLVFAAFQALIALTGNYGFFNLLAASLGLTLLDDRYLPERLRGGGPEPGREPRLARGIPAFLLLGLSLAPFLSGLGLPAPGPLLALDRVLAPLRAQSSYGLFAVMTKERLEVEVEGSEDGVTWTPYVFPYKPGDLARRPAFVAPHQPRLDWQMWFAALGSYDETPWFPLFLARLLEGSPPVMRLLGPSPFGHPPRYVRAMLYRYHFARTPGPDWWTRESLGPWSPVFARE